MRLEENINRIKEVMGIVTEAGEPNQGIQINLSNTFESGKYIVTPTVGSKVNPAIIQIRNFITKNPGKPILVTIESSESKVPNYDREKFPSTGDKNKDFTPDKKLPVGALSKNRANNIATYLKSKLPQNVTFKINDKGSQGPPWSSPFNAADTKYTQYQYIKVFASLNVSQPSTGSTATERVENLPEVCNKSFESQGIYGNAEKGFIAEQFNIDLGEVPSTFYFKLESFQVPDILIVEYNGKSQTTGLLGLDTPMNRLLVGTIIGNYYTGARPWYLNDLQLQITDAQYAETLLKKYPNEYDTTSFASFNKMAQLKPGFFTQNKGTIIPYSLKPGQIKSVDAGQNLWESVEVIKIQQVQGVNTAKASVVGIVGTTKWRIDVKCGQVSPAIVTNAPVGTKVTQVGKYY
jgi:hypothetical protein